MENFQSDFSTGARPSPFDLRTFTYVPSILDAKVKGGTRWLPEDIDHQHKIGKCTSIEDTMHAQKKFKRKFSEDFHYLLQKKFVDGDWNEGSSIFSSLKVGQKYGYLPLEEWKWTTEQDSFLSYQQWVEKLIAIPDEEIKRLITLCAPYKIKAYAKVDKNSRDAICLAIDASDYGVACMFLVGNEWWTDVHGNITWDKNAIQPLRPPKEVVSGHAVTMTNYDGSSYRLANSWGPTWCEDGTAYSTFDRYMPREVWKVWYADEVLPDHVQIQLENRKKIMGQVIDLMQQLLALLKKKS
jgi:hypothetical protein